jgi:hypothetical protein
MKSKKEHYNREIPESKALDSSVIKLMRSGIPQRKAISMAGLKTKPQKKK